MNEGFGLNMINWVKWFGFKCIEIVVEVIQFIVGLFIDGNKWFNFIGIFFIFDF